MCRVSSVYFDTPGLSAYWEKLDGEKIRKKFRLRYYSIDAPGSIQVSSAFMEIKHRLNNLVLKERVALTDEGAQAILQDAGQLACIEEHITLKDLEKNPHSARSTQSHTRQRHTGSKRSM